MKQTIDFVVKIVFLCRSDVQTLLVRNCWSGLFTLGLAQHAETMSLSTMLMAILNHLQSSVDTGTAENLT